MVKGFFEGCIGEDSLFFKGSLCPNVPKYEKIKRNPQCRIKRKRGRRRSVNNCVYRFLNELDEVIYVGKAKNLKNRLGSHTHLPPECYEERQKIEYVVFETEADMDFAERYYISKYKPKFNVAMAERDITINTFELDTKVWLLLEEDEQSVEQTSNAILLTLYTRKIEGIYQEYLQEVSKMDVVQELMAELTEDEGSYPAMLKRMKAQKRRVNELKRKMMQLKKQRLIYQMGEAAFEETPDWLKKLYYEYGHLTHSQLLERKLQELKQSFLMSCLQELDQKGYYETLSVYRAIDRTFQITSVKSPDWLKLIAIETPQGLRIEKARKDRLVRSLIQDIEQDLSRIYQGLTQDVLMVKKKLGEESDWIDAIEVEQPVLIHRACVQSKLQW